MGVNACGRQRGILHRRSNLMMSVRALTNGEIEGLKRLLEKRYTALLEDRREDVADDVREAKQLSAALARIEEGTFGRCVQCSDDIDFKRLLAHPAATRCARCQSV
jgi:RNA polymerase-binding transcription factor DksA